MWKITVLSGGGTKTITKMPMRKTFEYLRWVKSHGWTAKAVYVG